MKTPLVFITLICCISCSKKNETKESVVIKEYTLEEKGGIFVEVFDSTYVNPNRFTENNIIFKESSEFIYSFEHIDQKGKRYFFKNEKKSGNTKSQWSFVSEDSININTIRKVKITVGKGVIKGHYQTRLQYYYPTNFKVEPKLISESGAIENESNVWIHPPRDLYFKILELNPFPFIKQPYKTGNKWNWSLNIGGQWGDERWKTWKGNITNKYNYEIVGKKMVTTKFGDLSCYIIESSAKSSIGKTKLTSYFNEKYGFIKLNYTNIDNSKTNLELVEVNQEKTAHNNGYNSLWQLNKKQ